MNPVYGLCFLALAAAVPARGGWVNITGSLAGKSTACGNTTTLMAVRGQNKVITGINGGEGLFATTDNGASWQPLGVSTGWVDQSTIAFDRAYPDTFWQCGAHGGLIHKTTDGGRTFTIIAGASDGDGISIDMNDPERRTIVFGAHEAADLRKTTDDGNTWTNITAGTTGWTNYPVVFDSLTYIVVSQNGGGISRTTDGGKTWTLVVSGISASWDPLIADDGDVYVDVNHGSSGEPVIKSADKGLTWTTINKPAPTDGTWYTPVEMPDGSIVAIAQNTLVQCSDGKTWKPIGAPFPSTGLSQGNIAYNEVTQAFFMSFEDCGAVVSAKAYWRLDFTSSAATGCCSGRRRESSAGRIGEVVGNRLRLRGGPVPSAASADLFDVKGSFIGRAAVGTDGLVRTGQSAVSARALLARLR